MSSYNKILPTHHLCISDHISGTLSNPPSKAEIINSIKSFKPLKASGSDGIHPFFYQKYINNILPSIFTLFNEIFISKKFPAYLNKTNCLNSQKQLSLKLLTHTCLLACVITSIKILLRYWIIGLSHI